jgi:putative heme iron utilization protein
MDAQTHAALGRALLARCRYGVLSTRLDDEAGTPYGSLILYADSPEGEPLLLLSGLAEHTRNLRRDPRASLLVTEALSAPGPDPLDHARVTLVGEVLPSEEAARGEDRRRLLEAHPAAARYIDFADFGIYRLRVERARYVGGFGQMSWVRGSQWGKGG